VQGDVLVPSSTSRATSASAARLAYDTCSFMVFGYVFLLLCSKTQEGKFSSVVGRNENKIRHLRAVGQSLLNTEQTNQIVETNE
jgi:hypothetical protein